MEKIHYLQSRNSALILSKPHPLFGVEATLSPYAGCLRQCVFCPYAASNKIGIKTNFLHLLDKKLEQEKRIMHLGLGSTCDPYCDEEKNFKLTRNTIELVMKYKPPLQIFTKSELIARDIDLFKVYSRQGLLAVSISVFTTDYNLSCLFEPDLPSPGQRFKLLHELRKNDIFAGIVLAPILPYISDSDDHLEEVFSEVKKAGGEYILPSVLVSDDTVVRDKMKKILSQKYPNIQHRMDNLYDKDSLPSITYTQRIEDTLKNLSRKHGIPLYLPAECCATENPGIRHKLLK